MEKFPRLDRAYGVSPDRLILIKPGKTLRFKRACAADAGLVRSHHASGGRGAHALRAAAEADREGAQDRDLSASRPTLEPPSTGPRLQNACRAAAMKSWKWLASVLKLRLQLFL